MSLFPAKAGRKPKAKPIESFENITTYKQYSMMPDEARERMFLQWCTRWQRDPELEGNPDSFFDTLDQTEPAETPDAVLVDIDEDTEDEDNTTR